MTVETERAKLALLDAKLYAETSLSDDALASLHVFDLEPLAERALEIRNETGRDKGWEHPVCYRMNALYLRINQAITDLWHETEAARE